MNLDSHVTLSVVFSFISMIGTIIAIYAVIHTRNKEGQEKEVEMTKNFTRLEVKLDTQGQQISNISHCVEKQDSKLDDALERLSRFDERLVNLEQRVSRLEGGK